MRQLLGCVLVLLLTVQGTATVAAQNRVALVIGNSAYRHAPELKNPANDAADMSAALRALGFSVMTGLDLDKQGMDRTIRDFAAVLRGADMGALFYAGHGLQVSGANYLVPVDAQLTNPAALDFEMVRLDLLQRVMERETATNVLFLDACRDNPLTRNLARAMGTRSAEIGRGLAPAESGVGTLVSFSTQPGNVALDGTGRNSPYAGALVKLLATPGEDVSAVLIGVRNEVMAQTGNRQIPWEHSALRARLYLATGQPPPRLAQPPAGQAAPVQKTQDQTGAATVPAPAEKAIIASKTASVDEKRPAPLAVGETVKGRLGASKNYHYWKVDTQPGKYRVVIDVKRADGAHSNIQSAIVAFAADGGKVGEIVRINDIEFRTRAAADLKIGGEPGMVLRVSNETSIVDYWLGVFPTNAQIVSPYFVRPPTIIPLALGKSVSAVLEHRPGMPAEAWYSASLQGTDYRISVEFVRSDGRKSNVQGTVDMFGPIGEPLQGIRRLCRVNEIELSGRCSAKLSFAEDAQVLFRVTPDNDASYTATFAIESLPQ